MGCDGMGRNLSSVALMVYLLTPTHPGLIVSRYSLLSLSSLTVLTVISALTDLTVLTVPTVLTHSTHCTHCAYLPQVCCRIITERTANRLQRQYRGLR